MNAPAHNPAAPRLAGGAMEGDRRAILLLTAALTSLGLVMVYSSAFVVAEKRFGDPAYFLLRHSLYLLLGFAAMMAAALWDYHRMARLWRYFLIAAFAALALVLAGTPFNGARRWISLGFITLQPSEAAKILLLIGVSAWAARRKEKIRTFRGGFLPAAALTAGAVGLVAVEPDLGTAVLLGAILCGILFVAGVRLRHALPALLLSLPPAALLAWHKLEYIRGRWETFAGGEIDPLGKGYHITQALIAEGSGGWFGAGLGAGQAKLFYLPEAHNDFILAVIGEELGWVGAAAVVCCFALFVWCGRRIAQRAPDPLGTLLATGVVLAVGLQAAMHVAVVTHAMPTKGIGLPFVSYGGSSLIALMAGTGLLLNVAAHATAGERGRCGTGFQPVNL